MSQVHDDVMAQIDSRKEPMELAKAEDQKRNLDKLPDDPTTDPEGAERRASSSDAYPPFVYEDYKESNLNLWGKKWTDGKQHLVPKNSTVAAVLQIAKDSENSYGGMFKLAYGDSNKHNMVLLRDTWTNMLAGVDDNYKFPIMRQLGNIVNQALAERAFQKYMYRTMASRHDENEQEPEWLMAARDRMLRAAAIAGTWVTVHAECWKLCEYKNLPVYYLENDIKLRLVNNAKYLEERYADKPQDLPKVSDRLKLAMDC